MAGDENLNQDDIEQLLGGNSAGEDTPDDSSAKAEDTPEEKSQEKIQGDAAKSQENDATIGQDDIEALLKGANTGGAPSPSEDAESEKNETLGQNDIESLLNNANASATPADPSSPAQKVTHKVSHHVFPEDGAINKGDVEYLLNQAEEALESIRNGQSAKDLPDGVRQFRFEHFGGSAASTEIATLDMIKDVDLDLRIELGRTHMYLQDVLKLRNGSVVPLDKLAGDPVDIFVNGRLIAKGEVLVLNDNFCVRIAELIAGASAAG